MFPVALLVIAAASFTPIRTLPAAPLSYARDAQYEYLGTADGLWRTARIADPSQPLQRIAFPGQQIHSLVLRDGKLYVGKQPTIEDISAEHTLVVSADQGATFTPIDEGLRDCSLGCGYMAVRAIVFDGSRIFVNAGQNLMVSSDGGGSWHPLFPFEGGAPQAVICPLQFAVSGQSVLLGGECPLDFGWIGRGTLRPDFLGFTEEVPRLDIEDMANRNVQFIERVPGTATVFAGVEGGLLRSDDGGASFRWSIYFPLESHRYPYIHQFVRSVVLVAGGFDKGASRAYLALSADGGETWSDISVLLGTAPESAVTLIVEESGGRILVALQEGERTTLGELVLQERPSERRRSVRH
jgi:hypothetical protein